MRGKVAVLVVLLGVASLAWTAWFRGGNQISTPETLPADSTSHAAVQRDVSEAKPVRADYSRSKSSAAKPDQWALKEKADKDAWVAKLDSDGDGVLSEDEAWAAKNDWFRGTPEGRRFARRFDTDGDGLLSDVEASNLRITVESEEQAVRQRWIEAFDLDGDGELDESERSLAADAKEQRAEVIKLNIASVFDEDSDGALSADEWRTAVDRLHSAEERRDFRERYDSDQSGTISAVDFDAFVATYDQGLMAADVNYNGVVDQADIGLFRDLMLEHGVAGEEELDLWALFGKDAP